LATFRFATRAVCLAVPFLCMLAITPARAGEAEDALSKAISLFEEGSYLTAQEVLLGVNREALSEADRTRRDDYLERVQSALTMVDKATKDLEDGEKALGDGKLDDAAAKLRGVLANEYAPPALRASAENLLKDVARRRAETPAEQPESAAVQPAAWESSLHLKEEEFARALTLGLFDYLRKSRMQGFVVSLSGGADSAAVVSLVHTMTALGVQALGVAAFRERLGSAKLTGESVP